MSKLFGKVMASLLSGAMLFGGTSFADGGDDLPKVLRKAKVEEVPDKAECIICLTDRVEEGVVNEDVCDVVTGCGHYFCRKCILRWMSAGRDNSDRCPVCRSKLDVDSAKSLLTSYERLQFEMRSKYNKLIAYCKEHPDVALNAAALGVYFPLVLVATIYSLRNQKKSKCDCDSESDRSEKISGVDCGFDGCYVDDVCVAE